MSDEALFNSRWLKEGEVGQEERRKTEIVPVTLSQPLNAQEVCAVLQRQY